MSEDTNQTFLPEPNSVAETLKAAGFHKTGIARAVTELVWEYLGIHANMGDNLIQALWVPNKKTMGVLWIKQLDGPITIANIWTPSNDANIEIKKAA